MQLVILYSYKHFTFRIWLWKCLQIQKAKSIQTFYLADNGLAICQRLKVFTQSHRHMHVQLSQCIP